MVATEVTEAMEVGMVSDMGADMDTAVMEEGNTVANTKRDPVPALMQAVVTSVVGSTIDITVSDVSVSVYDKNAANDPNCP